MKHLFIPLMSGLVLWGAACVPPRNGPPRPPKPPTPPHGAIQQALPDTAFIAPVLAKL